MEGTDKEIEMLMDAVQEGDVERVRELVRGGVSLDVKDGDGSTALMHASEKGNMDVVRFLVDGGGDMNAVDKYGKTMLMYASMGGNMDVVRFLVDGGADVNVVDKDGKTMLMHALEWGNMDVVRFLVDDDANVNAVNKDGKTALMYASRWRGDMDVVRALVDRGADVNVVDKYGKTALMYALQWGNMDVVRYLVDRSGDMNVVDKDGKTMLMHALEWGRMDVVRALVDRGADVNTVDKDGMTALMYASARGNMDVVQFLVDGGTDVNAVDKDGKTALMYASQRGGMDVVRFFVDRGADVNAVDKYGKTALMYALQWGNMDIVRFLVDGGGDVNAVNKDGKTALMYASKEGNMDVVRFLIDGGADANAVNNARKTMLMYASMGGNMDVVRYLVDRGGDVNAVNNYGKTALMYASRWRANMDVVRFLVDGGSDVNAVNMFGKTALMYASERGRMDVVRFLVDRGADVNAVDNDGMTALMYASLRDNMDVVRFFVDRGADVNIANRAGQTAVFFAASKGYSAIQRLLIPFLQVTKNTVVSSQDGRQEPKSQSSTSWFISPFEIELQSLIDQEDVGVQFRAKWLDADVVVKLFIPGASMASFAEEVTLWRQLRHPNVIKLYGACDVGHYFFVFEFASNGSLAEHLAACRRTSKKCTPWKFLHEAALGLAYLHERKIVHGDLRGRNILIGSDGLAKLSEFALSVSTRASGLTGPAEGVFGSTRWQSPERVEGGEATCASDVYSLGLCIVEALSGEIPWKKKSDENVIRWKKHWDPADDALPWYAPGRLTFDVTHLVTHMCALDPARRVTASVAAQMLERLATKEHAEHQVVAQQPEPEPQVSIDEYKNGELSRLWFRMQDLMLQHPVNDLQRRAFDEVQTMYEWLRRTSQPWKLLEQFHKLLVDVDNMARPDSYQNRIQRLSSTRATGFAMDGIRRRLDAMWATIEGEGSETDRESRDRRWREQRAKQLDLFVSEIEQTLLVLNELETEEDHLTLLAILKSEMDDFKSNYTPAQRSVIGKAYEGLVEQHTKSDVLTTTPEWFLPWYELEIDSGTCVGRGGFGGVYCARWLDSEVVVKLLDQVNAAKMGDISSIPSYLSSSVASRAVTNQANREEQKKMREMFAREVSVWFGLSHPHVVRLFGACHIGTQFFACEYASNGSLDKYLRKHPNKLWQKLYEAALGVQYLHARRIVHGDLKCNNILVGADGKAKVTDFGLSSDAALLEKADTKVTGAWQWVAPECLEHGASQLSTASDIYALGMCIIEALRVVETVGPEEKGTRHPPPLPWGDVGNSMVKYHVLRKRELPMRPKGCKDVEWNLVTRMCAFDPTRRLKISTVVSELGKLAMTTYSGEADTKAVTAERSAGLELVTDIVTQMTNQAHSVQRAVSKEHKTLLQIFSLFWDRLEHLFVATKYDDDVEGLQELVDRAKENTTAVRATHDTLVEFTQTAIGGYALHRSLDKLIEANFWRIDNDGEKVHDWKRHCKQFLDLVDSAS